MATDDTERHDWTDLVQSPGWTRLVTAAKHEWEGQAFVRQVETLTDRPDDLAALSKLRQMMAAKRAIERLLNVPRERLSQLDRMPTLTGQDLAANQNRRGRL
jgi:hypothetical protein